MQFTCSLQQTNISIPRGVKSEKNIFLIENIWAILSKMTIFLFLTIIFDLKWLVFLENGLFSLGLRLPENLKICFD